MPLLLVRGEPSAGFVFPCIWNLFPFISFHFRSISSDFVSFPLFFASFLLIFFDFLWFHFVRLPSICCRFRWIANFFNILLKSLQDHNYSALVPNAGLSWCACVILICHAAVSNRIVMYHKVGLEVRLCGFLSCKRFHCVNPWVCQRCVQTFV